MSVYEDIKAERQRQDAKWGGPEHDDSHYAEDWATFILKRIEEIHGNDAHPEKTHRQRFIEIAALAVAAIESHDRDPFLFSGHPEKTHRQRFIEIAALAVAAIESHDRDPFLFSGPSTDLASPSETKGEDA